MLLLFELLGELWRGRAAAAPEALPATRLRRTRPEPGHAAANISVVDPAVARQCVAEQLERLRPGDLSGVLATNASAAGRRPLAWATPIFPGHFHYTTAALELRLHGALPDVDLYYVFTSHAELHEFRGHLDHLRHNLYDDLDNMDHLTAAGVFTPLVLSDFLDGETIERISAKGPEQSIVTTKKYFATAILHPCYELLLTPDAEVELAQPARLLEAARERAHSGIVLAAIGNGYNGPALADADGHLGNGFHGVVIADSSEHFPQWARERVDAVTVHRRLYSWFSDLPVWIAADIPRFLAFNGVAGGRLPGKVSEFDHLSYELFKLAHGEWSMVDAARVAGVVNLREGEEWELLVGSLEFMLRGDQWRALQEWYPRFPHWLSKDFCRRNPEVCLATNPAGPVLIYHQDREWPPLS